MLTKEFSKVWTIQFGKGLVPKVWLVRQQPNRLKNLVFEVSSVFGIELVLKVDSTQCAFGRVW